MVRIITFLFFCLFLQTAAGQISCGTNAVHEQLLHNSTYKAMLAARKPLVVTAQSFFAEPDKRDTIQVVIHIIHQGAPLGSDANPADDYIRDVFKTVNECFKGEYKDDRGLNKKYGVDVGVYFKIATETPSCEKTTGIIRVDIGENSDYRNYGVKAEGNDGISGEALAKFSNWDNTRYLNIWLVNKIDNGFYSGYAYFPTGQKTYYDGVIIQSDLIRFYDLVTHEIGHSLFLYHTFEGGRNSCPANTNCAADGDMVCDTDPVNSYVENCSGDSINPCTRRPYGNLLYNYMSYSCSGLFTKGQRDRMRAALATYRSSWLKPANQMPGTCTFQPAQFLNFTTENRSCNSVRLNWVTSNEALNKGYYIEYSYDKINYNSVGYVPGSGNTQASSYYSYNYQATRNQTTYFRIKQIAWDGWEGYSDVAEVNVNCVKNSYAIYPNPTTDQVTIVTGENLTNTISIYDAVGKRIQHWPLTEQKTFDVRHYSSGVYTLMLNGKVRLRFMKY